MNNIVKLCFIIVILVVVSHRVAGRTLNYRIKRISDNHLADLETKIGFNDNYHGILVTMPVGGGKIDPKKIGRKRRSEARILDILFNQSEEDRGDPLGPDYDELYRPYIQK